MFKLLLLLSSLAVANALFGIFGSYKSTAVKGKLLCNGEPLSDIRVKLYEKELIKDYFMGNTTTDSEGRFHVEGKKMEVTGIEPKINIYHKCGYTGMLSDWCYQKFSIRIPQDFITEGEVPQKEFDIGTINMAGKFSGQSTDCFNRK